METVAFRIPQSTKAALDAAAETEGVTATNIIRDALEDRLGGGRRRVYELAGYTTRFDEFLDGLSKKHGKQPILLMVVGRDARPYVYDGFLHHFPGGSVVGIKRGEHLYVVPRAFIVGWHGGDAREVNELAMALSRDGWAVVTKGYLV